MSASFDVSHSGVYRAPEHAATLRPQAEQVGCAWVELPLAHVLDKVHFFKACEQALKLPAYFGHNWDGLADCLRDLQWLPAKGYVLHISGPARFIAAAADEYRIMLDVFAEAARFWQTRGVPFIVLVEGAGLLKHF